MHHKTELSFHENLFSHLNSHILLRFRNFSISSEHWEAFALEQLHIVAGVVFIVCSVNSLDSYQTVLLCRNSLFTQIMVFS